MTFLRTLTLTTAVLLPVLTSHAQPHSGSAAAGSPRPIPICDLFGNLRAYDGKVILVRGEVMTGPEQFLLYGVGCKTPFITNGKEWPYDLHLKYASSEDADESRGFQPDFDSLAAFSITVDEVERKNKSERGIRGCVTIRGLLRVRDQSQGSRPGYGHLGAAPAQLVLGSIYDYRLVLAAAAPECLCCGTR